MANGSKVTLPNKNVNNNSNNNNGSNGNMANGSKVTLPNKNVNNNSNNNNGSNGNMTNGSKVTLPNKNVNNNSNSNSSQHKVSNGSKNKQNVDNNFIIHNKAIKIPTSKNVVIERYMIDAFSKPIAIKV